MRSSRLQKQGRSGYRSGTGGYRIAKAWAGRRASFPEGKTLATLVGGGSALLLFVAFAVVGTYVPLLVLVCQGLRPRGGVT